MIAKEDYEKKADVLIICCKCNWKGFVRELNKDYCDCWALHCFNILYCYSRNLMEVGKHETYD